MDNEYENEGGITIGYIFRTIFSQKWLALIIVAVITIVGTLGIHFISKRDETYSVSFVSKIPGSESSPQEFVFPDGKEFRYETMVSLQNLQDAQKTSDSFKNIDIAEMYENGDISVSRVLTETVTGSKQYEATYVITAKTKYFKTDVIARDFLSVLTQFPNTYISGMKINYDRSLEASRSAIQYDKQLDYLSEQVNFLNTEYDKFIEDYTGNFVVKDGKTLNYYQAQLQTFLDRGDIMRLKNEAIKEHYVIGDENGKPLEAAIAKYTAEEFEKQRERDRVDAALQNALDKLLASSDGQTASVILDTESVIKYTAQLAQLDQDLQDIRDFKNNAQTDKDFDAEVEAVEKQVEQFTKDFADVASIVYTTKTTVSFLNTSVIEVDGGMGIIMSAVISLVAGIVVAAIVAYAVGWSKEKKLKSTENESADFSPVGEQPQDKSTAEAVEEKDTKNDK